MSVTHRITDCRGHPRPASNQESRARFRGATLSQKMKARKLYWPAEPRPVAEARAPLPEFKVIGDLVYITQVIEAL